MPSNYPPQPPISPPPPPKQYPVARNQWDTSLCNLLDALTVLVKEVTQKVKESK